MDQIEIGNTVIVEAVSGKGKNRIREHGDKWRVVDKRENGISVKSESTRFMRNIHKDDSDFTIVEVWP